MITIKKNRKPEMGICKMICDKPLHEKLKKYDMFNTCFLYHHTTAIIGKPGQGKSSLIYSLFSSKEALKKCFNTIFYICPSNSMDSMGSDNIFSKLPEDQIYNELNEDVLNEIINRAKNRDEGDKIAIIIDDMAAYLKNKDVQRSLKEIAMNKRHLGIYGTFILSQTYKSVPFDIRRLYTNIILFKVSPDELETIFIENLPQYKEYNNEIQKIVFDKPHEYLVINTETGKLYKKFNEIIINE